MIFVSLPKGLNDVDERTAHFVSLWTVRRAHSLLSSEAHYEIDHIYSHKQLHNCPYPLVMLIKSLMEAYSKSLGCF